MMMPSSVAWMGSRAFAARVAYSSVVGGVVIGAASDMVPRGLRSPFYRLHSLYRHARDHALGVAGELEISRGLRPGQTRDHARREGLAKLVQLAHVGVEEPPGGGDAIFGVG